jgi:DNA-3-methyladenine glycosylase
MKLDRKFYSRDTEEVAKELLEKILVYKSDEGTLKGKIVETEAYFGKGNPASHAYGKKTKRNYLMFETPGNTYIYFNYGSYWLLNVVAKQDYKPGAVLIRAIEPLKGIDVMKRRRGIEDVNKFTNGPGKLTIALGLDKRHNGLDLTGNKLFLEDSNEKVEYVRAKRIGISKGKNKLLRFFIKNNTFGSKPMR